MGGEDATNLLKAALGRVMSETALRAALGSVNEIDAVVRTDLGVFSVTIRRDREAEAERAEEARELAILEETLSEGEAGQ